MEGESYRTGGASTHSHVRQGVVVETCIVTKITDTDLELLDAVREGDELTGAYKCPVEWIHDLWRMRGG
jgi:hypothetical protein